jgi:putative lipoprotein
VIRLVAFTVAVFGLASCAPLGSTPSVIHVDGIVFYVERLALPPSAVVDVQLRDTARAGAPARTLATQRIPATQGPPFKFALSVPATDIDPHAALSVFAAIHDGERLMFITDTRHSVPREGATGLEIRLTFVASTAGGAAPGIVTPVPIPYRCGGDTFRVAFEEGRAYVTLPDGSVVMLERLRSGGDPESPRTFTDGRLTFVQEIEGMQGPRVLFARGRMMPVPCIRAH